MIGKKVKLSIVEKNKDGKWEEKEILEVDEDVASKSGLIKNMIEVTRNDETIPISNIKIHILKKVMKYCEKHKNDTPPEIEKPIKSVDMLENVSDPWDAQYIDIENLQDLFDLILAANYLDIKSLLDLSCAKVASLIKEKNPEEIMKVFTISTAEFTPEEQAAPIKEKEESKWANDFN